jgi:hypothetical protein
MHAEATTTGTSCRTDGSCSAASATRRSRPRRPTCSRRPNGFRRSSMHSWASSSAHHLAGLRPSPTAGQESGARRPTRCPSRGASRAAKTSGSPAATRATATCSGSRAATSSPARSSASARPSSSCSIRVAAPSARTMTGDPRRDEGCRESGRGLCGGSAQRVADRARLGAARGGRHSGSVRLSMSFG